MNNKLLIISGPTGVGKTKTALQFAKLYGGELISADSRQVYKGMDIVTGKEINKFKFQKIQNLPARRFAPASPSFIKEGVVFGYYEVDSVKLWGLDIVGPDQNFDVSRFTGYAQNVIKNIWERRKLPIIVGGTGFWIRSLLRQPETVGLPINSTLRAELKDLSVVQLQEKLRQTDKQKLDKMNNSDRNNPRRLIRAIEIGIARSKNREVRSKVKIKKITNNLNNADPYSTLHVSDILWIGLKIEIEALEKKIKQRVLQRVKEGAIEEAKKLSEKYGWDIASMTGIGYQDLKPYIQGNAQLETAIDQWALHELQYAKRQMTWFKKEKQIEWFDVNSDDFFDRMESSINMWLHFQNYEQN